MFKKIVSGIMLTLLLIGMLNNEYMTPLAASPIATVYVNPPISYANIGESFIVNINVADVENLYAWQANMSFDPHVLQFVNVTEGDFLKGQPEGTFFPTPRIEEGWVLFSCSTIGYHTGVSGSGTLATVEFLVLTIGESILNIDHSITKLFGLHPLPVPPGEDPMYEILCNKENGFFTNLLQPCVFGLFPEQIRLPEVGDEFQIRVNITDVEDLGSWEFKLCWDPAVLVCDKDFTYTPLWTEYVGPVKPEDYPIVDNQTGRFWTSMIASGTAATFTGSATIVELNFKAIARGTVLLEFKEVTLLNGEGKRIPYSVHDGIVYVTELPVHNIDTGLDYLKIQDAIDAPQTHDGHRIHVDNGTYPEHLTITKAVSLIGESREATISYEITVKSSNVIIKGLTIEGGILVGSFSYSALNVTIRENFIVNAGIRIMARFEHPYEPFCNDTIAQNFITNTTMGIHVMLSRGNKITGNTLVHNEVGILLDSGNNTVTDNRVEGGGVGIHLDSLNNTLTNNALQDNIFNFGFGRTEAYPNIIDASNTINDRPIYFIVNQSNILVDPLSYPNPGYLAVVNCENVTVRDFVLSGNGQGIFLQGGEGNTLLNNTLADNVVGLEVLFSNRNEIVGNTISNNGLGMWLLGGSLNTIANNGLRNNTRAILGNLDPSAWLVYGSLRYGFGWFSGALILYGSSSNTIIGNTIIDGDFGVFLAGSSSNTLRTNAMICNTFNFAVDAYAFSQFVQDIDDSNTVEGKPIIYWVNAHERKVPENAGYVAIINSSDITIRNLDISNNIPGILVVSSNNSLIRGNKIANCSSGIFIMQSYQQIPPTDLDPSINITVHNNIVVGSGVGILLHSGEQHTVSSNNLYGNLAGIHVRSAEYNMISSNTVTNSTSQSPDWRVRLDPRRVDSLEAWWWHSPAMYMPSPGISLETGNNTVVGNTMGYNEIGLAVGMLRRLGNNTIYHNNFISNTYYQVMISSENVWDNGYPLGGNYWSNYSIRYPNITDEYHGESQNILGSDGVWDCPYVIDSNNTDNYPLTKPYSGPHDIGITNVTTSKTVLGQGYNLSVSVEILNYGINAETFSIFVHVNATISDQITITLSSRDSVVITFTWDTTGVTKGNYTISATADQVLGETDTADNTFIDGWIIVTIAGDIDGNYLVNHKDLLLLASAYGSKIGDTQYVPEADINWDGRVDHVDLLILASNYGEEI